jgi:hypothetical protein
MIEGADPTIRLADLYAKQIETTTKLAVIAEQLQAIPDHEARIRALERWRYSMPIALLAALASAGAAIASAVHS